MSQRSPSGGVQSDPGLGGVGAVAPADVAYRLAAYGIDPRARSALRALTRFHGLETAGAGWSSDFAEGLLAGAGSTPERERALRRFLDLFFQLPARDFDPEWLDDLQQAWHCAAPDFSAELPMRAAHDLIRHCVSALQRGRDSYSRLDADIALAVGASALLVAGLLAEARDGPAGRAAGSPGDGEPPRSGVRTLRDMLGATLALDPSAITGTLMVQVDPGSTATRAMEEEAWNHVYARSLARLRNALRARDLICRVGRSRFAVVMPGLGSQAQILLAANKIVRLFETPLSAAGRELRLMARIGAAWGPEHGTEASALVRASNLALDEAARVGRPVVVFDSALLDKLRWESEMEEDFLRALDCGALKLYFQPQIDLAKGCCTGSEALLRWPTARGGPVSPLTTIEVAARLGMVPQLTRWIVHQACRCAAQFGRAGVPCHVSINLTAGDVADPELPLAVRNAMDLWHVEPNWLTFELTESAMLANEAISVQVMARLRDLGVGTSIDDFGTGYSSVILLRKLPLDELKLDRCFVANAVRSRQDREIVRSLILLAHSLELEVVAEGVEDGPTLALLRELGCDRVQGYLISHALAAEDFVAWARTAARGPSLEAPPLTPERLGAD